MRDKDFLQTATIVTDPVAREGEWSQILALTNLVEVSVEDDNLTADSEQWTDDEFLKGSRMIGRFREVTFKGKAVLYV